METGQLIGMIIGITSVIPGIVLSVFYKQTNGNRLTTGLLNEQIQNKTRGSRN